jgi:hypothetical protein
VLDISERCVAHGQAGVSSLPSYQSGLFQHHIVQPVEQHGHRTQGHSRGRGAALPQPGLRPPASSEIAQASVPRHHGAAELWRHEGEVPGATRRVAGNRVGFLRRTLVPVNRKNTCARNYVCSIGIPSISAVLLAYLFGCFRKGTRVQVSFSENSCDFNRLWFVAW